MNNQSHIIVHIIQYDKFTSGYINFMMTYFPSYNHHFITKGSQTEISSTTNIHSISDYRELNKNIVITNLFLEAKTIIVSGVFGCLVYLNKLNYEILSKTFLHFWGGDYYCYSTEEMKCVKNPFKALYRKHQLKTLSKKVYGIINLIPSEFEDYCRILNVIPKSHFVAPMPEDPLHNSNNNVVLKVSESKKEKITIILGNSATKSNNHLRAFSMIEHIKDKVDLICPLSYGDTDYSKIVIEKGKEIFQGNFFPITKYIPIEEYNKILSDCDIGIFNMRRQQALGNIYTLLQLGKKIYLNPSSPQYKYLLELGVKVFDINEIEYLAPQEIKMLDKSDIKANSEIVTTLIRNPEEQVKKWAKVFSAK